MDQLDLTMTPPRPTKTQPMLGTTFLLVEDSRLAAEGFRLLCLRSGARIRRADSLLNARRHLRVYRPTVALIDMTLPDGTGDELIAELRGAQGQTTLIATSGDPGMEALALAAGADAFLLKPVRRIADFQSAILPHLPAERRPVGPRALVDTRVDPDPVAYRDDLHHAAETIREARTDQDIAYVAQFLSGVAESAGDPGLARAARTIAAGGALPDRLSALDAMVQARISASPRL